MKQIIAIVGPTGVGKTKLSIELAKHLNAEIINGDATQVYKYLNIGSAKVTEEEKEGIPHHLFDIVDPKVKYTVYDYQKDARKKIKELQDQDKQIIIVGGSGLYLKSLLYDYNFSETKEKINFNEFQLEDLYKKIKEIDPNTDIPKNNRQRIEGALRFYNNNGFPISMQEKSSKLLYDVKIIGLTTDRETLYDKINRRVEIMIEGGLLNEVRNLTKKYPQSHIMNSAIGYKELKEYFKGTITLEDAISAIKHNSTTYAKRQYTWFNNQMNVKWYQTDYKNFDNTIKQIKKDL